MRRQAFVSHVALTRQRMDDKFMKIGPITTFMQVVMCDGVTVRGKRDAHMASGFEHAEEFIRETQRI